MSAQTGNFVLPSDLATEINPAPATPRPNGPRVPTLCRLACQGFERFFADRAEDPRLPGQIPRAVIAPWWNAVTALCGPDMEKYELRLKTILGTGEFGDADQLAIELQKAALKWTERVLAELDMPEGDRALKALFKDPLVVADVREIARILTICVPLKAQISLAFSLLAEVGQMEGRRILELSADTVVLLKNQYVAFADIAGSEARYFALALVNRMVRPWQILLVGRALAWRPDEPGSLYPEFDGVASRLVLEAQRAARDIASLAAKGGDLAPAVTRLCDMTMRYLDEAAGIAGSFGPAFAARPESPWNAALRAANGRLATVFDRAVLSRIAAVVLGANTIADSDPNAESAIEAATAAARLLSLLLERGGEYGFAGAAQDCLATLAQAIEDQTARLIAELHKHPAAHGGNVVAMLRVTETLFKNGPGAQLARNLRMARQSTAA